MIITTLLNTLEVSHSQEWDMMTSQWPLPAESKYCILESKWTFVPNLKKFPRGILKIWLHSVVNKIKLKNQKFNKWSSSIKNFNGSFIRFICCLLTGHLGTNHILIYLGVLCGLSALRFSPGYVVSHGHCTNKTTKKKIVTTLSVFFKQFQSNSSSVWNLSGNLKGTFHHFQTLFFLWYALA